MARAQQQVDQHDGADGDRERGPVDRRFPPHAARCDALHHRRRQAQAGAAAERRHLGEGEHVHLRHHPGADGEVGAPQAEDDERRRHGEERRGNARQRDRGQGMDARVHRQHEERVAAEPQERLLPDRDQPGIAREQVPELREGEVVGDLHDRPHVRAPAPEGERDQDGETQQRGQRAIAARAGAALDPVGGGAALAHRSLVRGKRPLGRSTRTIRKATWPARICPPGWNLAPIAWATPRITPPASVPHRLPSPPIMTASKA